MDEEEGEVVRVRTELASKAAEVELLQGTVKKQSDQIAGLQRSFKAVEKAVEDRKGAEIRELQAKVQKKEQEVQQLQASLAESAAELEALRASGREQAAELEALRAAAAAHAEAAADAQGDAELETQTSGGEAAEEAEVGAAPAEDAEARGESSTRVLNEEEEQRRRRRKLLSQSWRTVCRPTHDELKRIMNARDNMEIERDEIKAERDEFRRQLELVLAAQSTAPRRDSELTGGSKSSAQAAAKQAELERTLRRLEEEIMALEAENERLRSGVSVVASGSYRSIEGEGAGTGDAPTKRPLQRAALETTTAAEARAREAEAENIQLQGENARLRREAEEGRDLGAGVVARTSSAAGVVARKSSQLLKGAIQGVFGTRQDSRSRSGLLDEEGGYRTLALQQRVYELEQAASKADMEMSALRMELDAARMLVATRRPSRSVSRNRLLERRGTADLMKEIDVLRSKVAESAGIELQELKSLRREDPRLSSLYQDLTGAGVRAKALSNASDEDDESERGTDDEAPGPDQLKYIEMFRAQNLYSASSTTQTPEMSEKGSLVPQREFKAAQRELKETKRKLLQALNLVELLCEAKIKLELDVEESRETAALAQRMERVLLLISVIMFVLVLLMAVGITINPGSPS